MGDLRQSVPQNGRVHLLGVDSNSKTFQDGNGNGNFWKINSNDFQDGNWESMEMKGRLRMPRW